MSKWQGDSLRQFLDFQFPRGTHFSRSRSFLLTFSNIVLRVGTSAQRRHEDTNLCKSVNLPGLEVSRSPLTDSSATGRFKLQVKPFRILFVRPQTRKHDVRDLAMITSLVKTVRMYVSMRTAFYILSSVKITANVTWNVIIDSDDQKKRKKRNTVE